MAYSHEEKDEVIKRYPVDGEPICPSCMEEELEERTNGEIRRKLGDCVKANKQKKEAGS